MVISFVCIPVIAFKNQLIEPCPFSENDKTRNFLLAGFLEFVVLNRTIV